MCHPRQSAGGTCFNSGLIPIDLVCPVDMTKRELEALADPG